MGKEPERKVIQGVPFWVDNQKRIYAYEGKEATNLLWLGMYNDQTDKVELRPDWEQAYKEKLETYRKNVQPKSRLPANN